MPLIDMFEPADHMGCHYWMDAAGNSIADAGGTDKQLLLLDTEALSGPDDVSSLLVSPKGWLCTLEHKSCQYTCV